METLSGRDENIPRFEDFETVSLADRYYLVLKPLIVSLKMSAKKYATGTVLDIACGNKPYEKLFEHCIKYIGCDIVQSSSNKVDLLCEADKIPLDDSTFNTILCTQAIEHIGDYKGMLSESFRLLKTGGHLILSGPMYWHLHEEPHDYYRFTKHGFKYILEDVGFEIIDICPNGGKWALFGQIVIHTFPHFIVKHKIFRKLNNWIFEKLDKKHFDDINTMNYLLVARK